MPMDSKLLSIRVEDLTVLRSAYMPFLKNGGLFVSAGNSWQKELSSLQKPALGSRVFLLLQLLDEPEKVAVTATVVWITPASSRAGQCTGFGLHFDSNDSCVKSKIETLLAECLSSDKETQTL